MEQLRSFVGQQERSLDSQLELQNIEEEAQLLVVVVKQLERAVAHVVEEQVKVAPKQRPVGYSYLLHEVR